MFFLRLDSKKLIASLAALTLFLLAANVAYANSDADEARYASAVASLFRPDQPGATIIVTKNGKTVFRRAYGLADVERKTPLVANDVMRIGSITKPFTAVAIMMLEEQGKLSLQDDFTKHLPNFPPPKQKVTIEHLLTHTSGIPSYTSKPQDPAARAVEMSVEQVIDSFKHDLLEFTPGSQYRYNNSGYFLLGAIVEHVSGMRYADFLAKHVFVPLSMKDTAYEGFERAGGSRRIEGYSRRGEAHVAVGASAHMSQPYAAGALIANVDDLARWDAAISAGQLLRAETWERVFTPHSLSDGGKTTYGYGWNIVKIRGRDAQEHGGAIVGFRAQVIRIPQERVFVAVLANSNAPLAHPSFVAEKLAAIAIGDPYPELKAVKLDTKTLDEVIGVYKIDETENRVISRDADTMYLQRTGRSKAKIVPVSASEYYVDNTFSMIRFNRNTDGEVVSLTLTQQGIDATSQRIAKTPPPERVSIQLSIAELDQLVGDYQLSPQFTISIRRDGSRLLAQATGQSTNEIFATSKQHFFLKTVSAEIEFIRDSSGKATELVLIQNGRRATGKRVN